MSDIDKDYQDYLEQQEYARYQKAKGQQATLPQLRPDTADKAAHPKQETIPSVNPDQRQAVLKQQPYSIFTGITDYLTGRAGSLKEGIRGAIASQDTGKPIDEIGAAGLALPASSLPTKIVQLANYLQGRGILPGLGRVVANALTGAAQGAVENPQARLSGAGRGALIGAGGSALLEPAAGLLSRGSGLAMQAATGAGGVEQGERLARSGLWGTKAGMESQIPELVSKQEQVMEPYIANRPDLVQPEEISAPLEKMRNKTILPDKGTPSISSQEAYDKITQKINELKEQGPLALSDVRAHMTHSGKAAYTKGGEPKTSTDAEIERQIQGALSSTLKSRVPETAEPLANEAALLEAGKSLSKKDDYGLMDVLRQKIPGASLGLSTASQLLRGLSAVPRAGATLLPYSESIFAKKANNE